MSQTPSRISPALVIACIALAVSIYAAAKGSDTDAQGAITAGPADARGSGSCVDPEARAQLTALRRALGERDARIARGPDAPDGTAAPAPALPASSEAAAMPPPRRFTHFESSNPAVSVSIKDDGSYDIRSTDPSLAGSVVEVTAVTETGQEATMFVRVPPAAGQP